MFLRNKRGKRRASRPLRRFLLAVHVVVSGGWLGVVAAKLVLCVTAASADEPVVSGAFYESAKVVDVVFPPAAIATFVTGVLLTLGTKWDLLGHYWVATKLALTVGVIVTAVGLGDRFVRRSVSAPPGRTADEGTILGAALAPETLLISLSAAHLIMLGVATVVSVYKPWGKTRLGRVTQKERRSRAETTR